MTNHAVSTFLNQIFFKHNKFDCSEDVIRTFQPFMFSYDFLIDTNNAKCGEDIHERITLDVHETVPIVLDQPISNNVMCPSYNNNTTEYVTPNKYDVFSPHKQDTLFWCIFTAHHGEAEYTMIGNRYKNVEIEEKIRILEYIQRNVAEIKNNTIKLANTKLQEIQAELMVNKQTSMFTFYIMCIYYKIRALVVYNKTYMDIGPADMDTSKDTYIFSRSKEGYISVHLVPASVEELSNIVNTHILLDFKQERPLKALSAYKLSELESMAEKLDIRYDPSANGKWKKNDWYEAVLQKCSWNSPERRFHGAPIKNAKTT